MSGPYRLSRGGLIDRTRRIPFTFNSRSYQGFAGDSLASALLANGVRTVARSFKFHRPRGIFSCGVEETGGLLQTGEGARATPSERAPLIELTPGLHARSQAGWPSLNFDLGRSLDLVAPLWAAGFYNKTFIWPSWHLYEPVIRRMAGLGRSPVERDPDRYEVGNLHCDVLVVGGGVAGLKAALEAGRGGARVTLVEQDHQLGGEAAWSGAVVDRVPANIWMTQTIGQLNQLSDVRLMSRTTAVGYYDHNVVTLVERGRAYSGTRAIRERYWLVRTKRVVLATGAIEQPLIFAHNDRPGIMLAGAARQYLRRYGVAIGSRVLIATNNDSAYALAKELKAAGVTVVGVADARGTVSEDIRVSMRTDAIPMFGSFIPIDTAGFNALSRVTLGHLSQDGLSIDAKEVVHCDALAVSGGFSPTLHLYAQAGGKLCYEQISGSLSPQTSGASWPATKHPFIDIVGAAASRVPIGPRISPLGKSTRKWVDLLHDVTVADLELAQRENFTSIEHVKRYTTVGMAADQGKTSGAATLEVVARLRDIAPRELGHTTLRPPFVPVTLGAIAGRETGERFAPHRLLPLNDWHVGHGALMQDFGEWRRPVAYPRTGETREQAMTREAMAVRSAAGLLDGSSLGKIEVQGPDALELLDRFYINNLKTLKPGRARYGIMLRESGVIFDDGTVVMLAPDHFLITTTSGNASRVAAWLEEWHQCEWPHLRVVMTSVTDQWATISLAGPRSREILSKLDSDIDLSNAVFPHLGMREGRLLGLPARVYRVSFTGELTYEINVPSGAAPELWQALLKAGSAHDLQALGLDALLLMRLEKGFLHIGTDTDGTTVPDDVGWGKVASGKNADFIGKRSLLLPENVRPDRLQLIGLTGVSGIAVGSHLRFAGSDQATDGWVTSAGHAALTGEPIAMALLRGGRAKTGSEVSVHDMGSVTNAKVVEPPFYDRAGDRMNA
jgi:sarcosine oxidase subunit alpha